MKSGLCAGGRSNEGSRSSCRMAGHEERESATGLRQHQLDGCAWRWGEGVALKWLSRLRMSVVDVNDLMGLLPKSAMMVSHRPSLWRSMREERNCSALL
jgi:hypothetical protein